MKGLPKGWRIHDGRDPEEELRKLKRRFQAVSDRFHRARRLRSLLRQIRLPALLLTGIFAVVTVLVTLSPWPFTTTVRHLASFPSCGLARAIGLAPAYRGDPGYWAHQDEDSDGRSCETWKSH
ncbi:excalibur calcium-binding domain-containing protein [Microvirga subterranea]|uniref:Excalibur calcium-binding domain-containing protein n=1 Tax=Microvirga subterranea TaxID=186651 RepID=A0A370HWL0_9HYPH|nr:hypothetical protein DES45_101611 [Microvirga subterranea]